MSLRIVVAIVATMSVALDSVTAETVIQASRVATDLSRPVYATAPHDDFDRLFILEQHRGEVQILDLNSGEVLSEPFLDVGRTSRGNEQGLLGMAFDPNYETNGFVYVNYTATSGETRVDRYTVSENPNQVNAESVHPILRFSQPQGNHNGGWMGFGPDNFLYISSGDGGGSNDVGSGHTSSTGNSQDITNNLLGKMLRLDVAGDDFPQDAERNYSIPVTNPFVNIAGDDEIWAYGLRNAWRSSFDRESGDMYIADVGQGRKEEINFQRVDSPGGENYGWRLREGTIATPGGVGGLAPEGAIDPIHEYEHVNSVNGGFSITGGYVYRGPIEELQGSYFFADYVTNQIWSLDYDGETVSNFQNRTSAIRSSESIGSIASFGEDAAGNLYVVSLEGDVYRFEDVLEQIEIVNFGSTWKYLDDGSDQGTAWRDKEFDDSSWAEGPAELGYGDDPATTVSFGDSSSNKHPTTYFRHEFELDNLDNFAEFSVDVVRDDGAAVYLNGVEILRSNLAPNADFESLATASVGGSRESEPVTETFSKDLLVSGVNQLAVEVHQRTVTSSDLRFDLRLNAVLNKVSGLTGDFNGDEILGVEDIDALLIAIRSPEQDFSFDLNDDEQLDTTDRDIWVQELRQTWYGDANLDGLFDSTDLIAVFTRGLYEIGAEAGWGDGDWSGDGLFTSTDLVLALQDGGYAAGRRGDVNAVPEPTSALLASLAFVLVIAHRRRIHRTI